MFGRVFVCIYLLCVFPIIQGCAPATVHPVIDPSLAEKEALIQRKMAVEERVSLFRRLSDVSQSILTNGTPLCGDSTTYYLGMDTNSIDAIPEEWRVAYKDALGIKDHVTVTYVLSNSPAEKAGFQAGDTILYLNGEKIEPGKNCYKKFMKKLTGDLDTGRTMVFWVERDGLPRMLQATPVKRCDYPVILTDDMIVNAFADGQSIIVTKGMMKFVETDEELALVIGHELGHNVMGHIEKSTGNRVLGAILDGLIAGVTGVHTSAFQNVAGLVYSQEYEQEADYVGMYFMERGGFDGENAPNFWRRMGANFPYAIGHATTHPTSASRYVFLEKCVEEIQIKKSSGKELLPEFK